MRRRTYGVAIKHNLDRLIAASYLGHKNSFFNTGRRLARRRDSTTFQYRSEFSRELLLFSIPFLWAGVTMTVKRLKRCRAARCGWSCFSYSGDLIFCFFSRSARCRERAARGCGGGAVARIGSAKRDDSAGCPGQRGAFDLPHSVLGLFFLAIGTLVIGAYGWGLFGGAAVLSGHVCGSAPQLSRASRLVDLF